MSFLDNLEDNLKSLESREESGEHDARQQQVRAQARSAALASASFAEELKKGPFTAELLRQTTRIGHSIRTKIHVAWLGSNLRLEARERRLELRPAPSSVTAVYFENGKELRTEPIDLKGSAEDFLRKWLEGMAPRPVETPVTDESELLS